MFGTRVVEAIEAGRTSAQPTGAMRAVIDAGAPGRLDGTVIGGVQATGWRAGRPLLDDSAAHRSGRGLLDRLPAGDRVLDGDGGGDPDHQLAVVLGDARDRLQRAMTTGAGVLRSAESLAATSDVLDAIEASLPTAFGRAELGSGGAGCLPPDQAGVTELANLVEVGRALLASATRREESRGAHTRSDHPETDPAYRRRIVLGGS